MQSLAEQLVTSSGRRKREQAFKAKLPKDFSAHGSLNSDDAPFKYNFFKCQSDMLTVLARKEGFDLSQVVVDVAQAGNLNRFERQQLSGLFHQVAKQTLRSTDSLFDIRQEGSCINLILPGTTAEKAKVVVKKLQQALDKRTHPVLEKSTLQFSIETLYETEKNLA